MKLITIAATICLAMICLNAPAPLADFRNFDTNYFNTNGWRITLNTNNLPSGGAGGGSDRIPTNNGVGFNATLKGITVADKIVGTNFTGNGAGLTNVPESGINGLTNDLANISNNLSGAVSTLTTTVSTKITAAGGSGTGNTFTTPTVNSPVVNGAYQSSPVGNQIPTGIVKRNSGAAFSGIYNETYGGSASAMSDHPARGRDIEDNYPSRKPIILITTRLADNVNNLHACTFSNVQAGVSAFTTNGYVQAWTNAGFTVVYMLEDGWLTNHRTSAGLLQWNNQRFPGGLVNGSENQCATNLTIYLRTNGFEAGVTMYAGAYVPSPVNWLPNSFSEYDINPVSGTTIWEYPGGNGGVNPFPGGTEIEPAMTPDSIHRDFSSFYANGVSVVYMQDAGGGAGSGYFDQLGRVSSQASLTPYYYNPGLTGPIATDSDWKEWYSATTVTSDNRGIVANHGLITGMFMGAQGRAWASKYASDFNSLVTESGEPPSFVTGSRAVGWIMGQVKFESRFLTNAYGYCHPTMGTDQGTPNWDTYTYADWLAFWSVNAFFNLNPETTGTGSLAPYTYPASAIYGLNATNVNLLSILGDVTGKPPVCLSLTASNSIWVRDMKNGDKLMLMENEDGNNSTNLSINWGQVGMPSNTIVSVVDAATNVFIGTYTNSFTWTVPTVSTFLFRLRSTSIGDSATNYFTAIYDTANNEVKFSSLGNRRFMGVYAAHGEVGIGTNEPTQVLVGTTLTVTAPSGGQALTLFDAGGGVYSVTREQSIGNLQITGGNVTAGVGLSLASASGEFARFGGQSIMFPTNAQSSWPTAPLTRGGAAMVNSNGYIYMLQSLPATLVWSKTNLISSP